jgi:hypothetical protein
MWVDSDILEEHEDGGSIYPQTVSVLFENSEDAGNAFKRTDRRHELTEETLQEIGARSETS